MTTSIATERERIWMTLPEQLVFVITPLHSGALNLTLHVLSLPLLISGAAQDSEHLLVAGFGLELVGHLYDFVFRFDRRTLLRALQVVWLQVLGTVLALKLLFYVF